MYVSTTSALSGPCSLQAMTVAPVFDCADALGQANTGPLCGDDGGCMQSHTTGSDISELARRGTAYQRVCLRAYSVPVSMRPAG